MPSEYFDVISRFKTLVGLVMAEVNGFISLRKTNMYSGTASDVAGVWALSFDEEELVEEGERLRDMAYFLLDIGTALTECPLLKTMDYDVYLLTVHWQNIRDLALSFYGRSCCLCGTDKNLNVHHRTYKNRGEENMNDLIVLCKHCHGKFHDKLPPVPEDHE